MSMPAIDTAPVIPQPPAPVPAPPPVPSPESAPVPTGALPTEPPGTPVVGSGNGPVRDRAGTPGLTTWVTPLPRPLRAGRVGARVTE